MKQRELLLTKEQSAKLDWKETSGPTYHLPSGAYAYRVDHGVDKADEEEYVKFANGLGKLLGLTPITNLDDTDFACSGMGIESEVTNSGAIKAIAVLTEEQEKEIFGNN